jgi:hypothetical protein
VAVKQGTRDDLKRLVGLKGFWPWQRFPETSVGLFTVSAFWGVVFLLVFPLASGAGYRPELLILGAISLATAVGSALRWVLVSRYLPDRDPDSN